MKKSKYLGLGYAVAGACLLAMPVMNIFETVPHFIGYALILRGIYCIADMNSHFEEARRQMMRMIVLSLARWLSILAIFGLSNATERPTSLLLVSFVLGVLDCIVVIPAWKSVFEGIIYLGTRLDGDAVFYMRRIKPPKRLSRTDLTESERAILNERYERRKKAQKRRGTETERLGRLTLCFFILKEVLATLPEFSSLTDPIYTDGKSIDLYQFIGLLRFFAMTAAVIIGIIWLVRVIRYAKMISTDKAFFERLNQKYESEVLTKPEIFTKRAVKRGLFVVCLAFTFSIDFYSDGTNMIPDLIAAALLIVAMVFLRKYITAWKRNIVISSLWGAVGVAAWILQHTFFKESYAAAIFKSDDALISFYTMTAVTALAEVFFIITVISVFSSLKEIIRKYTGYAVTSRDSLVPDEKIKYIHKALVFRLRLVLIAAVLCALVTVAYFVTLPYAMNTVLEIAWFIDLLVGVVFAVSLFNTAGQIFEQIEYKYMLL